MTLNNFFLSFSQHCHPKAVYFIRTRYIQIFPNLSYLTKFYKLNIKILFYIYNNSFAYIEVAVKKLYFHAAQLLTMLWNNFLCCLKTKHQNKELKQIQLTINWLTMSNIAIIVNTLDGRRLNIFLLSGLSITN